MTWDGMDIVKIDVIRWARWDKHNKRREEAINRI